MEGLDEMIWHILINDLDEAEEVAGAEGAQRLNFNRQNPLEMLSDRQFIQQFRLDKNTFQSLVQELMGIDPPIQQRITALSLTTKLLVTLMFCGQGSYQAVTRSNLFNGMSQASVSRSIEHITNLLYQQQMTSSWIKFPRNINELAQQRARFYNATGIPGGIGVIDCTHVAIFMPTIDEHIYVNRKNYHSLNVQLICDETLRIMNVNANFPGSSHDSYIWGQSNVCRIMEQVYEHNPQNNFFYWVTRDIPYVPG